MSLFYFFFFSSRRRHTRCSRDWSSDVCSSDLAGDPEAVELVREAGDGDVVPRDIDRDGLDEKPVAQGGGGDGAGSSDEELATGEGNRHRGKVTGAGRLGREEAARCCHPERARGTRATRRIYPAYP